MNMIKHAVHNTTLPVQYSLLFLLAFAVNSIGTDASLPQVLVVAVIDIVTSCCVLIAMAWAFVTYINQASDLEGGLPRVYFGETLPTYKSFLTVAVKCMAPFAGVFVVNLSQFTGTEIVLVDSIVHMFSFILVYILYNEVIADKLQCFESKKMQNKAIAHQAIYIGIWITFSVHVAISIGCL
ncbi:hypothetical protein FCV82_17020 [Vibrio breoganii]|uniref:Uncharacterized protein n=1 Tax=Vibrio breoganii TaxID=553239 RepID=A0AAP8MTC9_9VIBR|nr:hypothetical protein [Vibrio breoganii]NMO74618.1 hypothetical protein [Vibrio breoganii]NMR69930.1 hypothetical protein [Vibrio breoganii]OED96566.1 hypothetical protein A1QG_14970 [Vibrio breoganii ZF-29]PMG06754.1 hypothetical protein BCV02_03770 [Vibrio breoganii]PMG36614.1 hypothetical protein BCU93_02155 [Vibrio breoganii]